MTQMSQFDLQSKSRDCQWVTSETLKLRCERLTGDGRPAGSSAAPISAGAA